jgi:hypothetical protein
MRKGAPVFLFPVAVHACPAVSWPGEFRYNPRLAAASGTSFSFSIA